MSQSHTRPDATAADAAADPPTAPAYESFAAPRTTRTLGMSPRPDLRLADDTAAAATTAATPRGLPLSPAASSPATSSPAASLCCAWDAPDVADLWLREDDDDDAHASANPFRVPLTQHEPHGAAAARRKLSFGLLANLNDNTQLGVDLTNTGLAAGANGTLPDFASGSFSLSFNSGNSNPPVMSPPSFALFGAGSRRGSTVDGGASHVVPDIRISEPFTPATPALAPALTPATLAPATLTPAKLFQQGVAPRDVSPRLSDGFAITDERGPTTVKINRAAPEPVSLSGAHGRNSLRVYEPHEPAGERAVAERKRRRSSTLADPDFDTGSASNASDASDDDDDDVNEDDLGLLANDDDDDGNYLPGRRISARTSTSSGISGSNGIVRARRHKRPRRTVPSHQLGRRTLGKAAAQPRSTGAPSDLHTVPDVASNGAPPRDSDDADADETEVDLAGLNPTAVAARDQAVVSAFKAGPQPHESPAAFERRILARLQSVIVEHIRAIGKKIHLEAEAKSRQGDYLSRMKGCLRNAALGLYVTQHVQPGARQLDLGLLKTVLECVPPPSVRPSSRQIEGKMHEIQMRLRLPVSDTRASVEHYWTDHLLRADRQFMRMHAKDWPGHWEKLGL